MPREAGSALRRPASPVPAGQPHPRGRAQPAVQLRQRIRPLGGQPLREPGQLPVCIYVKGLVNAQQLLRSVVPPRDRGEIAVNGKGPERLYHSL